MLVRPPRLADSHADYAGVRFMGGRDANQKAAAAQATDIFQNHYPEFLVRHDNPCLLLLLTLGTGSQVFHQRAYRPHLDLLVLQAARLGQDVCQDERSRYLEERHRSCIAACGR